MRQVGEDQLDDIAVGAAILGTGGGGDPYIGKLLAKRAIHEHGAVTLLDVDEVPDDALIVPVAMMGAPTILGEKLPHGRELVHAFDALQDFLGRPITHTISAEAGGLNSTVPFVVATRERLPLVDADLMGRAFPELQMCLPSLCGITASPTTLADEKGNTAVIETIDNHWTERLARSITIDMGCSSMISLYPLNGRQLRDATVHGTLSLCEELGRVSRETRAAHGDIVEAIRERLSGFRLFTGKVSDLTRETSGGFARASATIEGIGDDLGSELRIEAQNEFLVASRDGDVLATVPDLIVLLDTESGTPITTEALRYGFRVTALAAPCDRRWRSPEGLRIVGPRYFGYDVDYVPIEERLGAREMT